MKPLFLKPAGASGSTESGAGLVPDTLTAVFPFAYAFLVLPLSLYLANQADLHNDLVVILPFLAAFVVASACLASLCAALPAASRETLALRFFYFGAFLILSDMVAPLELGEMLDGFLQEPVPEPLRSTVLEILLAAVVMFLAWRLPARQALRRAAPKIVGALILVEIVFVFQGLSAETAVPGNELPPAPPPSELSSKGNVYHITFDSFSSYGFDTLLRESATENVFEGFTFFRNNKANYLFTWISRASYMSGTMHTGEGLSGWMDEWKDSGLIGALYDNGYETSAYFPVLRGSTKVSRYEWPDSLTQGQRLINIFQLLDLWLLRLAPTFLNQEVYERDMGVFSRLASSRMPTSNLSYLPVRHRDIMRKLIEDESRRPDSGQYVWAHLYLPHGPYNLDRDCNYSPGSGYKEQSLCAVSLMSDLVAELKKQGKYDRSLIIFQSDHGSRPGPALDMSREVQTLMTKVNLKKSSAGQVDSLAASLLFMKPPLAPARPVMVSDRLTQLADIPATAYRALGIDAFGGDGLSVFLEEFPGERVVDIYGGFQQVDEAGRNLRFGKSIFTGEFNHFSYSLSGGWAVHDNVPVVW